MLKFSKHTSVHHNGGNLIDSLSGTICIPREQFAKLISYLRVVVTCCDFQNVSNTAQYFEDRFTSFYVDEPLSNYDEFLDRLKKAIPVLHFNVVLILTKCMTWYF